MFGELWFQVPESIRITLKGKVPNYPVAKDIILFLAGEYGDDFGNGHALEFAGPALEHIGLDSRLCLAAHGVEVAAKFALFPHDAVTRRSLTAGQLAREAPLAADPDARYAREIVVDLDELPFVVAQPHQFGNVVPVSREQGMKIDQAQIGSCANGRFEDIEIAARLLRNRKVAAGVRFIISPASQAIYLRCLREGHIETLVEAGCQVVTPGCGICQPMVGHMSAGEVCITSTTRNYRGRKGSPDAEIYLAGPLTVAAAAVAGHITDPREMLDA
jgi:homoaconitase/3-isopropylmalate dehydratase large subunit